jgi:DMSO/TMAO reductase YedYZ heme-binding membrane subunit
VSPARSRARVRRQRRPARSRSRRIRAHIVHHLITYLVWAVYLGVGLAVAASRGDLDHLSRAGPVVSAVAAVLLWPLIVTR